ncbi:MAG TPA: flagellar hook-basal body complex protein [Stellaceae bacterium]|nr:flagellar hook-basal body complex protein [Stellaceae bacterium]
MSVFGALYSGVSGLFAQSQALGMIADNISNANTTAYKETHAVFSTLVTQNATPTTYTPGGVQASPFTGIDQQGLLQASNSGTDLALEGSGFFVVNNNALGASVNGAFSFTRAGSFTIDANGNLKNSAGLFLQGQKLTNAQAQAIDAGNFNQLTATSLTSLQTVNVSGLSSTATPTSTITLAANLPAADTVASPARTMTVPVFDSLGNEHDMTLSFTRAVGTPATPSTQNFSLSSGTPTTGDVFQVTIDGQTFNTAALAPATPTLTDIASAINTAMSGSTFSAAVSGSNIVITDSAGNPVTGSAITATTGTEVFAGAAPTNGTPAVASANTWNVAASFASAGSSTATIAGGDNIVKFNSDGTLNLAGTTFAATNALSIAWDPGITGATSPQTLSFNLGTDAQANGLSQFGGPLSVSRIDQNGLRSGTFTGVSIDSNGIVTASFDNGQRTPIFIIPIATFPNPDGLAAQTGNSYLQTGTSGNFLLRESGTGAAGTITPSSLEGSTVDIATEFSNLIVTQRAYSADAKIITTADQMLQDLINAKQ